MKIQWKIEKKRGNIRPILKYSFVIENYERSLALPPIRICSSIAEPMDSWQEHCYPNTHERADIPQYQGFYTLEIISHKGKNWTQSLRLPWREDNAYPEVEASFELLRKTFEEELLRADASEPMEEEHQLHISQDAQQTIAPTVFAEKFLQFAHKSSGIMDLNGTRCAEL